MLLLGHSNISLYFTNITTLKLYLSPHLLDLASSYMNLKEIGDILDGM